MEYTGGTILLTIGSTILVLLCIVLTIIKNFSAMKKEQNMNMDRKKHYLFNTVSLVILSTFVGGVVGYYLGLLRFL